MEMAALYGGILNSHETHVTHRYHFIYFIIIIIFGGEGDQVQIWLKKKLQTLRLPQGQKNGSCGNT